jgi:hypothetical protein
MSRERSYFEHNGMPLQAAPNAGRVRHAQAPWLSTFGTHPTQAAEQKQAGMTGTAMPEPSDEIAFADAEGGERQQHTPAAVTVNEPLAAPSLLQRAASAGSAGGAPSFSASRAGAQPGAANAGVSAAMGIAPAMIPPGPSMPVGLAGPMPTSGAETKSTGGRGDAPATPATGSAGTPREEAAVTALPPRVLVQKHITIQTEVSTMSAVSEAVAMPLPGPVVMPLIEAMASPMMMAGTAVTETGSVFIPGESFAAAMIPQTTAARFEAGRVEMGAGNMAAGRAMPPVMPEGQPHSERSQQALLDRLNYRPAPQQEGRGRRVRIGNLHITVQRPAIAAAQAPPSAQSAQPQPAAAAPQTFFNPWERLCLAID